MAQTAIGARAEHARSCQEDGRDIRETRLGLWPPDMARTEPAEAAGRLPLHHAPTLEPRSKAPRTIWRDLYLLTRAEFP